MTEQQMVDDLLSARARKKAIPAFTKGEEFPLKLAYDIQAKLLAHDLARGAKISGYKMGLTSFAKQRDVGVNEPIHGYLLEEMELKSATLQRAKYIHPRFEPEVAVVFREAVAGGERSFDQILSAVDRIVPAIEILDSRYEGFSFKLPDVVADNTSASGYVLGRVNLLDRLEDLRLMGVVVKKNGEVIETGVPAAVLGNPLVSLQALFRALGQKEAGVESGMVVLTGGITASVSFEKGDQLEVNWPTENFSLSVE